MNKPSTGIAVDGMTAGNPGLSKYRGIDLETGEQLFEVSIGYSTNNICEFVGLSHAIAHAMNNGYENVYCDSKTALAWVRKKEVNSSLTPHAKTEKAIDMTNRAIEMLKDFDVDFDGFDLQINDSITVQKWETTEWGEIPADYDRK